MVWQRHPDCVHPHFKNQPCPQRLCETSEPTEPHINDARKAVAEKRKVRRKIDEAVSTLPVLGTAGADEIPPPSKDRLEVAKKALTRAEISRRQREKDPEAYRKWNRERMRAFRKKK